MSSPFPEKIFDVAIIGGGINGVGVARDCAMRRLSTILLEKGDLGSGSTGACSGIIHGGPRYLETERESTRVACEDSGALERIAPNLVFRVPILIPALKSDPRLFLERVEAFARAYDRFTALKEGKPHVRLSGEDVAALDPGYSREVTGAVSLDEWGVDPFRLVVLTAKSAVAAGAHIATRTRVESVETSEGKVYGVVAQTEGHEKALVRARIVLNLTGPWAQLVDPKKMPSIQMRPTKGVYLVVDRRIVNVATVCQAVDGRRAVFLMPHEHATLIGSTDDDFYGHPDRLSITQDEVGYLLQAVERYFPDIRQYRITRAFAGVRPLAAQWGVAETKVGREHQVFDHAQEGAEGLYTMIGGRLSSYRMIAEEMTDIVCRRLKRRERCRTHLESLPGCTPEMPWREEARRTGLDPLVVRRLMTRHGYNALAIFDAAMREPELRRTLCECEGIIAAEVEYCVREEWARTPADIFRRTGLGGGPCQSCRCAGNTATFIGGLIGKSSEESAAEARRFLEQRWVGTLPVLYGEQAKQEEYARSLWLMSGGGTPWRAN